MTLLCVIFIFLILLAGFCALAFGSVSLSASRIAAAINGSDRTASVIIFKLRLPRLAAAALAGAGLAVAGHLLQSVTDNELAAPNIIGINAGAGFAVMLILCLFPSCWRMLPAAAFVGALAASFLVLTLSGVSSGEHKSSLVLAGVALSSILNAGISFLSLKYPDVLSSYTAFSVGGFDGVSLSELIIPAVMIAVGIISAIIIAPKVSLLSLGDEAASALGINVRVVRIIAVIITSALCAAVVSFAGLLGFVGLIVPHIVRRLIGAGLRVSLPFSAMCGAVLVIFSDVIGRIVIAPGELPAGIIMAIIGAPFFLYLLIRRKS